MNIEKTVLMLEESKARRERWISYFLKEIQKFIEEVEEIDLMECPRDGIEKFNNILEKAQAGKESIVHMIYVDNFMDMLME